MKPVKMNQENKNDSHTKFLEILKAAALLPRGNRLLTVNYKLSRKQIYLIYLVNHFPELKLTEYAELLNVSNSTFTRNVEKLEVRKVLLREKSKSNSVTLRLLSLGQLYAIEIDKYFDSYFQEDL